MPSLYGFTSNANVRVGNTTGLYQQPGGSVAVLSSAQVLLNNLSQNGNVNFALDPAYNDTKVLAYTADNGVAAGTYGSGTQIPVVTVTGDGRVSDVTVINVDPSVANYGNANVAAYLPTYTGSLENSSSIVSLRANAVAQQASIDNLDAEYTSLNSTVISQGTAIGVLQANAATQAGQIAGKANIAGQVFTGNVQAPYFIGDGSQLTNLNVPSGSVTLTGNVTGSGTTGSPINTTITASGVTPGTYGSDTVIPSITVGLDGRVTQITTNAISGGGSYGNANVAAYLPTYNGSLENSSSIINLWANAAAQASQIAGANAAIITANTAMKGYVDAQDSAITSAWTANAATQQGQIDGLTANAATQQGEITSLQANAATQQGEITSLQANAASQQGQIDSLFSNAAAQQSGIDSVTNELHSFETWANANFSTSSYSNTNVAAYLTTASINTTGNIAANKFTSSYFDASNSAGGALRNSSGTPQLQWGAGGGNNVTLDVSTNMNGTNAQIDISPTGTGHVQIKPTGSGSIEIAPTSPGTLDNLVIGSVTPLAGTFTTLQTSGNITANTGGYFVGDGSQLTNLPTQTASGPAGGDLTGTYPNPTLTTSGVSAGTYGSTTEVAQVTFDAKGRATSASNVTISGTTPGGAAGGDLTGTYPNPTLTTSGVSAGTYGSATTVPQYTVDTKGRITSASNVAISFPTAPGFSGNLAGNTLIDSVNNRILANAFPQNTMVSTLTGTQTSYVTYTPVYTSGNLIATNASGLNQTIGQVVSGNVNLLTQWGAGNRTSSMFTAFNSITATSANTAMNTGDRVRATASTLEVNLNGKSWGTTAATMSGVLSTVAGGNQVLILGSGVLGQAVGVNGTVTVVPQGGTANVTYATAQYGVVSQTAGAGASTITYARLLSGGITGQSGNVTVTNAVGVHTPSGWVSSNVSLVTNAYTILNEDTRSLIQTVGNVVVTGNVLASGGFNKYGTMQTFNERVTSLGTGSGTQSINLLTGTVWTITLNGNLTLNTTDILNAVSGSSFTYIITQDGTGGWTLTSNLKYAGGSKTLSTAAGAIDVINVFYDGTNYLASLVKGYA